MKITFENKRVVVVGAAHGIGKAISLAFADVGAEVLACDILADKVAAFAEEAGHGRITACEVDVTDEASVRRAAEAAGGPVDVLVYVAGGLRGLTPSPLEDVATGDWEKIVDANMLGAFLFSREVVGGMKAAGSGRIVVISSGAGLTASLTGVQAYCAAKHGVVGFVKQIGLELAPYGITVNSVAPGFMLTSPDAIRQWEGWSDKDREQFQSRLAGRRLGVPEDIAKATLFLASDHASWITGQILPVSGRPT